MDEEKTFEVKPVQETVTSGITDVSSPQLSDTARHTPEQQLPPETKETNIRFLGYRKLVGSISDHLRRENALKLAYLFDLPEWYYEIGDTYDGIFALKVLMALEAKGVYSPENLHGLREALKAINREDCVRRVDDYLRPETSQFSTSSSPRRPVFHSTSMIISGDDVERDLGEPSLHQSQSIPNDIHMPLPTQGGIHSNATQLTEAEPRLYRSVSHQDFRLAIDCVITTAESLTSQISKLSRGTTLSSDSTHTPSATSQPHYLQQAIASAKQVSANLRLAVSPDSTTRRSPSLHSAPVTPGRSSPVTDLDQVLSFSSRKLSRSGSSGHRRVSKCSSGVSSLLEREHRVSRELSYAEINEDITPPTKRSQAIPPIKDILSAPQSEKMHVRSPSHVSSTTITHVPVHRTRSRREIKQFSRKGLLLWQIKVKKLRLWLTQPSSKIESEQFYDRNKRSFKAVLYPHGMGDDEGKYMTLTIDCLDEPRTKVPVPRSSIVVKLLDPQSIDSSIPTVSRLIERRGIRFIQQFISHTHVQELSSTGIIIITIAVTSETEPAEETDEDLL